MNIFAFISLLACILHGGHSKTIDVPSDNSVPELRELIEINGKNYYFFMQDSVTWYNAVTMCAGKNMTLASLQTQEEDDALNRWLIFNPAYDHFLWTSGARLDGATWRWEATGEDFTYLGWKLREPDIELGTPACMNFAANPRGWTDDDCNIFLHPLCEE